MSRLFYSLLTLFIALFFIMFGILSIMLPWSPSARTELILLILENSASLAIFGIGFLIIGLSIAFYIALNSRHTYYKIRSGPRSIKVDETIIQNYLDTYWKQLFPHSDVPHRFTLKRNKIHVTADLPHIPPSEQKTLLIRVNKELAELLDNFLGYKQALTVSASFQPEPKKK